MTRARETVTFLGDLKDCFLQPSDIEDGKVFLRLNCGSAGITTYASLKLSPEKCIFLARLAADGARPEVHEGPLEIDLGWVRYLKILDIDKINDQALIQFDLGGMSNTFLGVTALKIRVDRFSLAALVPDYEKKLMRERYQKIGFLRKWLWRWLFGKAILIGLPGVKIGG